MIKTTDKKNNEKYLLRDKKVKRYSRSFLFKFRKSFKTRPVGLKRIKVERKSSHNRGFKSSKLPSRELWNKYSKSLNSASELKRSENAWTPLANKDELNKSISELRGLLNKLSAESYKSLVVKIRAVFEKVDPKSHNDLVHIIYQKSVIESKFCELYANVCRELSSIKNFRKLLLKMCQDKFTNYVNVGDIDRKFGFVGCVRFLVHLYTKQVIAMELLELCYKSLTEEKLIEDVPQISPLNIEILCNGLMQPLFSVKKSNPKKIQQFYQTKKEQLESFSKDKKLPTRVRFLVMDVTDNFNKKY